MSYPPNYKGYDVDGVLVDYKGNGPIVPKEPYCIVTGNTLANWQYVVDICGSEHPIYASPYDIDTQYDGRETAAKWKSEMVKRLKLIEFYEDQEDIAKKIQKDNPNCEVFLVRGTEVVRVHENSK